MDRGGMGYHKAHKQNKKNKAKAYHLSVEDKRKSKAQWEQKKKSHLWIWGGQERHTKYMVFEMSHKE